MFIYIAQIWIWIYLWTKKITLSFIFAKYHEKLTSDFLSEIYLINLKHTFHGQSWILRILRHLLNVFQAYIGWHSNCIKIHLQYEIHRNNEPKIHRLASNDIKFLHALFLQILLPICATPAIFNLLLFYDFLVIFIDMSRILMAKAYWPTWPIPSWPNC
jgi:hypothetical protein